jgi:hypothetical protein
MRYARARNNLDRHPHYILAASTSIRGSASRHVAAAHDIADERASGMIDRLQLWYASSQ